MPFGIPQIIVGAVVFSAVLWALPTHGLGLNLFSEAIALAFASFVVQRFLAEAEHTRLGPAYNAMLRESLEVERRCVRFLRTLIEGAIDQSERDLLEDVRLGGDPADLAVITARISMSDPVHAMIFQPPRGARRASLRDWITSDLMDIPRLIERFIPRYVTVCPPVLLESMQALEACSLMTQIQQSHIMALRTDFDRRTWESLFEAVARLKAANSATLAMARVEGVEGYGTADLVDAEMLAAFDAGQLPRTLNFPGP